MAFDDIAPPWSKIIGNTFFGNPISAHRSRLLASTTVTHALAQARIGSLTAMGQAFLMLGLI